MSQPYSEVFAALHRAAADLHGAKLFTVTVADPQAGVVRRAYTSHPQDYPTTSTKPLRGNGGGWQQIVLEEHRTFVANTVPEFAIYFPDHEQIAALGCESVINIPLIENGAHRGSINILDKAQHFTPEVVADFEALVRDWTPRLLAAFQDVPMGAAA